MTRIAVVTGAAGGVGAATCALLQERGWKVIGIDRRPMDATGYESRLADVGNPAQITEALGDIERIDGLVNNAAVQHHLPIAETTLDQWDTVLDVNLRAAFITMKLTLDRLSATNGAVVNVASVHGQATSPNVAPYAASKGGLLALTRAAAIEFARRGVRVNAVIPGAVDTPALRDGFGRHEAHDAEERLVERTPLRRIGQPAEIAELIAFLLDANRAGFITGESVVVDGGVLARLPSE